METRAEKLAHLERLADELARGEFTAHVVIKGIKSYLKVANASVPKLNSQVLCLRAEDGSWAFWWPWQQPIGAVDDLETVVGKITAVLRSVEEQSLPFLTIGRVRREGGVGRVQHENIFIRDLNDEI